MTVTVGVDDPVKVNTPSLEFTTNDWDTYQTVTVTGLNDDVDNAGGLRSATITHRVDGVDPIDLSVSVTDDDTAGLSIIPETRLTVTEDGSDTDFFEVKLNSAPPNGTVSVEITATPEGTVTFNGTNPSVTLMFTDTTWNRPQVVIVHGTNDDKDNPGDSRSAIIKVDPSSGGYDEVASVSMSVTVTDDDTPKLTLSLEKVPLTEGSDSAQTATYTVGLATKPSGNVRVDVTSNDPKIATVDPESHTFTPVNWGTPQGFTVTSVPDMVDNDGRSVRMKHVAHGGGYNGVTAETEVTITDDDTAGLTIESRGGTVSEDGTSTGTVTVRLDSAPTSTVRVTVRSADPTIAKVRTGSATTAVASTTLTFTATDYNNDQTVTVVGVNDDVESSGGRTVDIAFRASGGGYNGITEETEATVTDNDRGASGISITPTSVRVNENDTETYTVQLDSAPTSTVRVTVQER